MKIAIFAYSKKGIETAGRIMDVMDAMGPAEWKACTVKRLEAPGFSPIEQPSKEYYGGLFSWADAMIFVGACGIAVRSIAPHVKDKTTDPAVLCVDELGTFVIPLLSGHIGGANCLAKRLADGLRAVPAVTTATDLNGRFSVDSWAEKNGFVIDDMALAKEVSAAVLEGEVLLCSDFPVASDYPAGVIPGTGGELGILLSWEKKFPFTKTLRLIPRCLYLGLGCRKDTKKEEIEQAVREIFEENGLDLRAVKAAVSIDLKKEEPGLLKFCEANGWSPSFYSAELLSKVPGEFSASPFVKAVAGVENVCERAAMAKADRLLVGKTARYGVTVAVGVKDLEVYFE